MNKHISQQYDAELDRARSLLLEMGGLVEQQLQHSCQSLYSHDLALAEKTSSSDTKINQMELTIDNLCTSIIARRQPAATDLRMLISIMKASTDLERIGDEAKRIAKFVRNVANLTQPTHQYSNIRRMAELVQTMLARVLDAFARLSADNALAVIEADHEVDAAYYQIMREMGAQMHAEPQHIDELLTVLWAARSLERCGDHTKNLAEFVVYLVRGKDVRHSQTSS
ncbi:MAG: phosphate signaling complex protein PhoU [Proteobacteria bacterium]|nr:phosphate signaling complex protein PhoU [Pseudomonadota bacterium]